MKRILAALLLLACGAAWGQTGPVQAWNVFTLPNESVTPDWHNFAPSDCTSNYDACADDTRFWEEWDFTNDFTKGIGDSFKAVSSLGGYQSVMLLMALGDLYPPASSPNNFADNVKFMYTNAAANGAGIAIEPVLFPKWKYGAEWCYLYPANAPTGYCQIAPGSSTGEALAYKKLLELMDYVQTLGGSCTSSHPGAISTAAGRFNSWFAVWYGWSNSDFPYQGRKGRVLKNFWESLPKSGAKSSCNLQASYITWLDSGYAGSPDVRNVQKYVESLGLPYWVNTELYSDTQIQQYATAYTPYQTVITGFWNAPDAASWAQGMCPKWKTASSPTRLGVWTFADRDVDPPYEYYRSYINGDMATVGKICTY